MGEWLEYLKVLAHIYVIPWKLFETYLDFAVVAEYYEFSYNATSEYAVWSANRTLEGHHSTVSPAYFITSTVFFCLYPFVCTITNFSDEKHPINKFIRKRPPDEWKTKWLVLYIIFFPLELSAS